MRSFAGLFVILAGSSLPVHATLQCTLTATPATVRAEGLTERMGAVQLTCAGGSPGAPFVGSISVALSAPLTNRETEGQIDVYLSVDAGGVWVTTALDARRISPTIFAFNGLSLSFDAAGGLALRIENVRAPGRQPVTAAMSFSGTPVLPVATPFVTLSQPFTSLLASHSGMGVGAAPDLPSMVDMATLLALRIPFVTTRVTENAAAAFERRNSGLDHGVRLRLRYTNVPAAARLLLPEYIAGSSAAVPTSAGDLGLPPAAGEYTSRPGGALLLGRVRGADELGAGGTTAPLAGPLGAMGDSDRFGETRQVVYEVLDGSLSTLETAHVPAFLLIPVGTTGAGVIRQSVSLAPLSEVNQISTTAPIPRFAAHTPALDCGALGDCNAPWFPRLAVVAESSLELRSPQNSGPQSGFIRILNDGGGLLEWRAEIRYLQGDGWLELLPAAGINSRNVTVNVTPGSRPLGLYRAEVTIQVPPPAQSLTFTVVMEVVPPLPPPAAVVRDVVNAADRIPGPLAPGSLIVITGGEFTPAVQVTLGGRRAPVVLATATEIYAVAPGDLAPGQADLIVFRGETPSRPFRVMLVEAAPAVAGVLNEDGYRNTGTTPARAGGYLVVFGTGVHEKSRPLIGRIHDRWITEPAYAGPAPGAPGIVQYNLLIPGDLPAMQSEVQICATVAGRPGDPVCSRGFTIWLRRD